MKKVIAYPKKLGELTRDEKGLITHGIAQDTNKNGVSGRPCKFCENKDEIMRKTDLYIAKCNGELDGQLSMPWMEELALILKVDIDTVHNWWKKEDEHPEFFRAKKVLFDTMQLLRLKQRALGIHNAAGSIFLMKSNHGMIETERKMLVGDKNDPVTFEIVEASHNVEEG